MRTQSLSKNKRLQTARSLDWSFHKVPIQDVVIGERSERSTRRNRLIFYSCWWIIVAKTRVASASWTFPPARALRSTRFWRFRAIIVSNVDDAIGACDSLDKEIPSTRLPAESRIALYSVQVIVLSRILAGFSKATSCQNYTVSLGEKRRER